MCPVQWVRGNHLEKTIGPGTLKLIFLFIKQVVAPQWDGSFKLPKQMFKLRDKKILNNYARATITPIAFILCAILSLLH